MKSRIESIDLLRGLVMIIMALDHVRDYFHADAFLYEPTDLSKTSIALFFTRWITHFCAPTFVFLAGTSAYLVGQRKGKKELSVFLLKRGLWLVFIELVITNFGWFFNFHFPIIGLLVIWAIAIGMISLAAFIHLPFKLILTIGILMIFGHNAFDGVQIDGNGIGAVLWSIVHQPSFFPIDSSHVLFVGYPVIPWIGVMMLGYCLGSMYVENFDAILRKKILIRLGSTLVILFVVIRFSNLYGDASPWMSQPDSFFTFLSFLNVSKYPPSLLYVLMTLGPALIFLGHTEKITNGSLSKKIIVIGRVPMFYYLAHIYMIHILAIIAAVVTGFNASVFILNAWITNVPELQGYGFSLGVTYLIWIALVLFLYPFCNWYNTYKSNHREKWWLSYL